MADEDGPHDHDYESIDDFLYGKSGGHRHSLDRTLSEEAKRLRQSRPFTLPRGSYSVDGGDPMNTAALQFPLSPPRSLPQDHNAPVYQAKVPICISEPATPVSAKQNSNTLRARPLLEDMQVPPPITRANKPPPRPPKPSKVIIERKEPKVLSAKPYSLSDFCAYEPLPKMVRVSAGYYGETEKTSISEGEEFVFYLLKTVQAIPAKPVGSLCSSEKFHIPISSMLKIAVIDKHSDSIRKYVYSSPSDLMTNRKECPRVVCVTKDHFIQSTLLPAGTLLFLDEKPSKKLLSSEHRIIRCKTRRNKVHELAMNSACHLTTHPADTQIYIREYQALVNKFPVDVQLFHGDSDAIYEEPSEVTSSIGMSLTLEAPTKQKSIIAKTDLEGTRKDNPITVEIPFDLPIEVEAIEREEENMEQIYSEVMDLYENFNPESVERSYATHEWNFPKELDDHLYHEYETADIDYLLECPNTDYEPLQEVLKAREQLLQERQASGASNAEGDVEKLKEENKRLQEEIDKLRQKKHGDYTKLVKNPDEDDDSYTTLIHTNVEELKTLDQPGVSRLLQNMSLPQYVDGFRENQIDGELFATLTEEDLSDLVQSSLHKKRLLLIATGQTSIRKYFDTENPYGVAVARKE